MATSAADSAVAESSFVQEKMAGPYKIPIGAPLESCTVPDRPALTPEQQAKYDLLLENVKSWKDVPNKEKGTETAPITDSERMWLTKDCLLRYLRATKWNEKEAEKRVRGTLAWRREFGVDGLTYDHISPEQETGKQFTMGYDKEGRVCHYLNPGRQNTAPSHRQVEHLVFMVERVVDIMPAQREKLALLINFKPSKTRSYTAPGIGLAREVLHILQTHYPERLGRALIVNVPWVVWGFFKLITPFIDPLTREKLKFNEDMTQYVPSEHLWTEFNGTMDFDYDHSVYWPALEKLCRERQAERERRWVAGGKHIGELEDYLAGFATHGVAPPEAAPVPAPASADAPAAVAAAAVPVGAAVDQKEVEAKADLQVISEEPAKEVKETKKEETKDTKPEELKMEELKVN